MSFQKSGGPLRNADDLVRCLPVELEVELRLRAAVVPSSEPFELAASQPPLRTRFEALVAQLDAAPVTVVSDVHGQSTPALVDGTGLRDLVFLSLYEPGLTRAFGRLVDELEGPEITEPALVGRCYGTAEGVADD